MSPTRREFIKTTGSVALGVMAARLGRTADAAEGSAFDIHNSFADFMRGIGGSASDGGGTVIFSGSDPILRSHFRIGTSMAIAAAAAGVGAAAIWLDRTGQGQDVKIDLREAVYNVNPIIALILQHRVTSGHRRAN